MVHDLFERATMSQSRLTRSRPGSAPKVRNGFTLMEVMVAMAIFVVAMTAIASLFPAAAIMQRQAKRLVAGNQAAFMARQTVLGRPLNEAILTQNIAPTPAEDELGSLDLVEPDWHSDPNWDTNAQVLRLPDAYADRSNVSDIWLPRQWLVPPNAPAPNGLDWGNPSGQELSDDQVQWVLPDRMFPGHKPMMQREFVWVPLIRDKETKPGPGNRAWEIYLFVLERPSDDTRWDLEARSTDVQSLGGSDSVYLELANPSDPKFVPEIWGALVEPDAADASRLNFPPALSPGLDFNDQDGDGEYDMIQAGDLVLDNNGTIYQVRAADKGGFFVVGFINIDLQTGEPPKWIWFAPPHDDGRQSPTFSIEIVSPGGVE